MDIVDEERFLANLEELRRQVGQDDSFAARDFSHRLFVTGKDDLAARAYEFSVCVFKTSKLLIGLGQSEPHSRKVWILLYESLEQVRSGLGAPAPSSSASA